MHTNTKRQTHGSTSTSLPHPCTRTSSTHTHALNIRASGRAPPQAEAQKRTRTRPARQLTARNSSFTDASVTSSDRRQSTNLSVTSLATTLTKPAPSSACTPDSARLVTGDTTGSCEWNRATHPSIRRRRQQRVPSSTHVLVELCLLVGVGDGCTTRGHSTHSVSLHPATAHTRCRAHPRRGSSRR